MREHETLIGVGSVLLKHLSEEKTLSVLWEDVKNVSAVSNYGRFVQGLDLLFVLGLVEVRDNKIIKLES